MTNKEKFNDIQVRIDDILSKFDDKSMSLIDASYHLLEFKRCLQHIVTSDEPLWDGGEDELAIYIYALDLALSEMFKEEAEHIDEVYDFEISKKVGNRSWQYYIHKEE